MKGSRSILFVLFLVFSFSLSCEVIINKTYCMFALKQKSEIISNMGSYNFGNIDVFSSSSEIVFTIENPGTHELVLTGRPNMVQMTAEDDSFTLNQLSTVSPVQVGSSTTFSVSFNPKSEGSKIAEILIPNDDTKNNPFKFTVSGTAIAKPEINIKQENTDIQNDSGIFDFGSFEIGNSSEEVTFTIENLGSADLELTDTPIIDKYGTDEAIFTLNQTSTSSTVTPGNSTTFTLTFTPSSIGEKTATIKIESNDADENVYTFTVRGEGTLFDAVGWIGGGSNGWKTTDGTTNANNYQSFNVPPGLCTDSDGNIYVAEMINHRICKWDKDGNAIGWIGGGSDGWKTSLAICTRGSQYRYFDTPMDVFVHSSGDIYVADRENHRISKWSSSGIALGWIGGGSDGWKISWGTTGGGSRDYFRDPSGIFIDSSGNIYVADTSNHRISKWDKDGNAFGWIGGGSNGWKTTYNDSSGTDYQSFFNPYEVFVDSTDNIYVAELSNHRISRWSSSGIAFGWIGGGSDGWKKTNAPIQGRDYQSFASPVGVVVDSSGNILIADGSNHRISKWSASGTAIGWLGGGSGGWKTSIAPSYSKDYQSFYLPYNIFLDSADCIYVAEAGNHRVSKWAK